MSTPRRLAFPLHPPTRHPEPRDGWSIEHAVSRFPPSAPSSGALGAWFGLRPGTLALAADQPVQKAQTKQDPDHVHFGRQIAPLLQKYCTKCHGGAKPRAKFALDRIKTDRQAEASRQTWDKVISALQAREMPPEGKPQPTAAERDLLLTFLDQRLAAVDCTKKRDPGRVTIRRLNRTEYNNTIRDLVGVNFRPADDFPADDVGYGFDNIGDVLTISPLLMEKYLAAAERIADQVMADAAIGRNPTPPVKPYARGDLRTPGISFDRDGGFYTLDGKGELVVNHPFPIDGEYTFRLRVSSSDFRGDPAKAVLRIDGKEIRTFEARGGPAARWQSGDLNGQGRMRAESPSAMPTRIATVSRHYVSTRSWCRRPLLWAFPRVTGKSSLLAKGTG